MAELTPVKQTGNKPRNIKSNNQKVVLALLRQKKVMSLSEIAEQVNLSKTTITKIVSTLMEKKYVISVGKGSSTEEGGKRPELFSFDVTCAYSIALQLRGGMMVGALMDLSSRVLEEYEYNLPRELLYEDYVSAAATVVKELLTISGKKPEQICGVVLGCDGIVDAIRGILRFSVHRKWDLNLPIAADLKEKIGLEIPIYVDNSCRFNGYAELKAKEKDMYGSSITIYTSYSTGGCILFDGRMLHGENGFMGEYGHVIVNPNSTVRCTCGGYGCFETMVSPTALLNNAYEGYEQYPDSLLYRKAKEQSLEYRDIFDAANLNDPFACKLMDQMAKYFAILIHNITLLHDPQNVILQGVYTEAGEYFINSLRKTLNDMPFYKIKRNLNISYSTVNPKVAFFYGASRYVADTYFNDEARYE